MSTLKPPRVCRVAIAICIWGLLSACQSESIDNQRIARESSLCALIKTNNTAKLQRSLRRGADPNGYCDYSTPTIRSALGWVSSPRYYKVTVITSIPLLVAAIQAGNRRAIEMLLEAGVDPNLGMAAAIQARNIDIAEQLIAAGADVNREGTEDYNSPLLRSALAQGDKAMANLLLRKGAKCNFYHPLFIVGSNCQIRE